MKLICKDTNKGSITLGLDRNVIVEYFNKIGNG